MEVLPVPSSVQRPRLRQTLTSFVVNGTVAIDAGALAFGLTRRQQKKLKHIFLSHTHIDHLATLPIFVDAVFDGSGECVTIHGTPLTLESLRKDIFNDRIWPDFLAISKKGPPFLKLKEINPRTTVELEGIRIRPIPVNHVVETMGFVVEEKDRAIIFSSDTGPTEELWEAARSLTNLKAVFLEVTFPDEMAWLADVAKHLTPALARAECQKMPPGTRILAVHLHLRHRSQVLRELKEANIPNLEVARFGKPYHF